MADIHELIPTGECISYWNHETDWIFSLTQLLGNPVRALAPNPKYQDDQNEYADFEFERGPHFFELHVTRSIDDPNSSANKNPFFRVIFRDISEIQLKEPHVTGIEFNDIGGIIVDSSSNMIYFLKASNHGNSSLATSNLAINAETGCYQVSG